MNMSKIKGSDIPVDLQDEDGSSKILREQIIVGIHGVGSPSIGAVAQSIFVGFAKAHPHEELRQEKLFLCLDTGAGDHAYQGIGIDGRRPGTVQIWEVNWSDLKGFPDGVIGSLLYAMKTLVAMIQLGQTGWEEGSSGPTAALRTGFLFSGLFLYL
jgi:hypothetical protein